jgi:hypothetical protein
MKTFEAQIDFKRSRNIIWSQLSDYPAYTTWHPLFASVRRRGDKLTIQLRHWPRQLTGTVIQEKPGYEFVWSFPLWSLQTRYTVALIRLDDGRIRFLHRHSFRGAALTVLNPLLARVYKRTYIRTCLVLRDRL